ncbi:DNA-binding transcriptional regulator, MerR family [Micromonospora humi]|uniref:DNA-binding transcriptional regulator, MerR family n=2 Tax=Micromonospora humi TaxID=745366 RepID=A0A1C5H0M6_9ACTN|nr:DNA-binding transcriptional regulator, MerR family [Micromonospora humi]
MRGMRRGLTIGEFATLTHLSVRTLRRYHEAGLLEPETVDPFTGYRYYATEQIPAAQVIHRLRELDVPLVEVKAILATNDPDRRSALIAGHLRRLEEALERTRGAVAALRRLLGPEDRESPVEVRSVPGGAVAGVRGDVELARAGAWYDGAMAELDAACPVGERTGPPGGQYANELFTGGVGAVVVYRPVRDPRPSGRVEVVDLPAAEFAVAVHRGPHDDIDVTYGRLGAWVVGHALAVDGPVRETYLVGPRDTDVPADWRTEIGWPVFRLSPA